MNKSDFLYYEELAKDCANLRGLFTVIEDQKCIARKAALVVKASAYAYVSESKKVIIDTIPRSFIRHNFDMAKKYIASPNLKMELTTDRQKKFDLITYDLQDFFHLKNPPEIKEIKVETRTTIRFNIGDGFDYSFEIPDFEPDQCAFTGDGDTGHATRIVESLNFYISKSGNTGEETVFKENKIRPYELMEIERIFRELVNDNSYFSEK